MRKSLTKVLTKRLFREQRQSQMMQSRLYLLDVETFPHTNSIQNF